MISEQMLEKMNEQIQKELYSSYLYLSMQAYFAEKNLDGFVNWFDVQVQEERDHGMKIYNFVNQVGGRVKLRQLDAPPVDFNSPLEVFEQILKHEQFITDSIYNLVNLAIEERDHKTNAFLQWYVTEQAEEESNVEAILNKLKLINNNPNGLFMLDAELAKRVYVPIPTK